MTEDTSERSRAASATPSGDAPADGEAGRQTVLAELGIRALSARSAPALLQHAAELVPRTLGTEFVKIVELLPDGETARIVAGVGWRAGVVGHATINVGRDSQAGYALLSHAPVVVEDLESETRLDEPPLLREHGVVSGISVILYGPEGRSYGVLGAHTATRRRFTKSDVDFLQGIANVLSAALHRQHIEDELRRATSEAEAYAAQLQEQALELEHQAEESQAMAEELEQTNEELIRATGEAERARDTSEFLAEASRLLTRSLDYATTLRRVADAAVPRLGDWCAVDVVVDPDPSVWPPEVERVAVVHRDPEQLALGRQLGERYPPDWSKPVGIVRVLREGTPLLVPDVDDEMLRAAARDPEHLRLMRALHFSSVMIVPLVAHGVTLGALTLCHTESSRHYDETDLALARDLAERAALAVDNARLYRDAESARRAAEEANQAKSQFLATMSHELRTPLNAITGYVQLLDLGVHGPLTEEQRGVLARIDRAERHLLGLINDVLNYARIESGRVEYELQPVLVDDIVREALPLVEPLIEGKGLTLDVRLPERDGKPPIAVWADREKLAQILLNLLSNAVKFTPANRGGASGRIVIELRESGGPPARPRGRQPVADPETEWAQLRVSDTGIGIPAAKHDAVFEPFVQVRSDLTREAGGTGLGLAISRDLAEGMGGALTVESEEGVGSTFIIALRRVTTEQGDSVDRRSGQERRTAAERRAGIDRRGTPRDTADRRHGDSD